MEKPTPSLLALLFVPAAVFACDADPPTEDVGTTRVDHGPPRELPPNIRADAPAGSLAPRAAFGLDESGDVVVFDVDTGSVRAVHPLAWVITDLCWDAHRQRLLVVEKNGWVDGSRVHALRYDGQFVHESSSPALPGDVRVVVTGSRVLAVADEYGTEWMELDEQLEPRAGRAYTGLPASLYALGPSESPAVFALNARARVGSDSFDELFVLSDFGPEWLVGSVSHPKRPHTSSRVVFDAHSERSWLARLHPQGLDLFAVAKEGLAPAGAWVGVSSPGASLEGVAFDPSQEAVVLGVAHPARPADELLLGAPAQAQPAVVVSLGGRLRRSPWFSRDVVLDSVGAVLLVATESGIEAFRTSGTSHAPAVERAPSFGGAQLRGPIALREPASMPAGR